MLPGYVEETRVSEKPAYTSVISRRQIAIGAVAKLRENRHGDHLVDVPDRSVSQDEIRAADVIAAEAADLQESCLRRRRDRRGTPRPDDSGINRRARIAQRRTRSRKPAQAIPCAPVFS